jgi:hypothetical protein
MKIHRLNRKSQYLCIVINNKSTNFKKGGNYDLQKT